jgi:hypothetical protein
MDEGGDEEAGAETAREGLSAFRTRLAGGDYEAVVGPGLRETLQGAAAETGLDAEIGALRLAMLRLLQEERDPSRMASGLARVAGVSVQAARLRQQGDGDAGEIRGTVTRRLAELEAWWEGGKKPDEEGGET